METVILQSVNRLDFSKMDELKFTKMHGTGNDYIYVDCTNRDLACPSGLAKRLSNRHSGIGSDGLVLIMPSSVADFRMRMFNADGSEGQMCGNAACCIGKYVFEKGLTDKRTVRLETLAGVRTLRLHESSGIVSRVTVDMGSPIEEPSLIPVEASSSKKVEVETNYGKITLSAVSVGNPHGVVFCRLSEVDVAGLGRELENHPIFPERANIEFVEVVARERLRMRIWERGSGETLSCGTGACAALVAGVNAGRCLRRVVAEQPGGCLEVEWSEADGRIYLTGRAEISFEGTVGI